MTFLAINIFCCWCVLDTCVIKQLLRSCSSSPAFHFLCHVMLRRQGLGSISFKFSIVKLHFRLVSTGQPDLWSSAHIRPLLVCAGQSEKSSICVGQWGAGACSPGDTSGPLGEKAPNGGQASATCRGRKVGLSDRWQMLVRGWENGSVSGKACPTSPPPPRLEGRGEAGSWRAGQLRGPHEQEDGGQVDGIRDEWSPQRGGEGGCEGAKDSWPEPNASRAGHFGAEAPGGNWPVSRFLRLATAGQWQHLVARPLQVFKSNTKTDLRWYSLIAGANGTMPQSMRARLQSGTETSSSSLTRAPSLSTLTQSRFLSIQCISGSSWLIEISGHEIFHLTRAGRRLSDRDCQVHSRHNQFG